MTAPGDTAILMTLLVAFTAATGYAAGRIHQWYRMGRDRDEAFRDGYDTATRSVFNLAARVVNPRRDRVAVQASARVVDSTASVVSSPADPVAPATPPSGTLSWGTLSSGTLSSGIVSPGAVSSGKQPAGRHTVPDELVQGPTHRLPADRVARARVRGAASPTEAAGAPTMTEASSRTAVPKPRSS
jgi:hypothetical protein